MLQFKVLVAILILLFGSTFTEVTAKAVSKRHVRRDWLIIPDTIAFKIYNFVDQFSPKTAEFLADIFQTPIVLETRNVLVEKTAAINVLFRQLADIIPGFWKNEPAKEPAANEPVQ
uniref:Apovitellenin-1 n=1 Tax=Salvator merianae TaxID=96440 RepID=A0A8D0DIJ9_SALMN